MSTISPHEKSVYLAGPRYLQNQLMAGYIEENTGLRSHTIQSLEEACSRLSLHSNGTTLLLCDCMGVDLKERIITLDGIRKEISSNTLLGLFNVDDLDIVSSEALIGLASGVFLSSESMEAIAKGICGIFEGELWFPRKVLAEFIRSIRKTAQSMPKFDHPFLTSREKEILGFIGAGKSNEEIAVALGIVAKTVRNHVHHLYRKIKVSERVQAVLWAGTHSSP